MDTAGQRPAWTWPPQWLDFVRASAEKIRNWASAEVGPGRLMPWLPVAFGFGVVLYFTAETEPLLSAPLIAALICAVVSFLGRARPVAFPLLLGITAIMGGFATATWRTAHVAHPVLHHLAASVTVSGFVEIREERERTDRIVVAVTRMDSVRPLHDAPERIRVSVRKGLAPAVGTFVEFKARLSPPLAPLRPGGYDFARDLFFQRIGASGFVTGTIKIAEAPAPPGRWLRFATAVSNMRSVIDKRIRTVLHGDESAIASALLTGTRDALSRPVFDAMYISGIGHVLSISGYHMAVVAGVVFFAIRALLALVPLFATRYSIKKWAGLAALAAAAFYLVLSGAEVATQRSFYMIAIVLIGVLVDRRAMTLRTLALAAIVVMLLAPEAVVHPSFQMSFAATLALVSGYARSLHWAQAEADTPRGRRMALWGVNWIVAAVFASLVAGLATTPYAAYTFHRTSPYGLVANILAMPVISAVAMPAGLLALLAMPFGFDGPLWRMMGWGIDWMIDVALWVANLPGAVGRLWAFGVGPLLLCTVGILLLCMLRSPLRWAGAAVIAVGVWWIAFTPLPDILIAANGDVVAVRTATGRLSIVKTGSDAFAIGEWLAADADARLSADPTLRQGIACDEAGCIGQLADGARVSIALSPAAFEEDCRRAAVVVTSRDGPPACAALLIDRKVWKRSEALALRRLGGGFEITTSRPAGFDRPWARALPPVGADESSVPARPVLRDATPRSEDLEADD
ncbi:MAG: competence protein ComEC [Alphaproteobacteria bacterium]|nr:competence protein ComEC [Alphaproteobacteria bacterium]